MFDRPIEEAANLSDRIVAMSTNPGRIDAILHVRLARPRNQDMIASS
jgi:NitT/TauT family transport system ATP-binding protein